MRDNKSFSLFHVCFIHSFKDSESKRHEEEGNLCSIQQNMMHFFYFSDNVKYVFLTFNRQQKNFFIDNKFNNKNALLLQHP